MPIKAVVISSPTITIMLSVKLIALLATLAAVSASPLADCTVTKYNDVADAVKNCKTLTLKDIQVPASTTLDLKLQTGTTLTLEGTFKWEYAEWAGPLFQIAGSKVTVKGNGVTLDGRGAQWWDGKGSNGGVKKPKFFRIKTTDNSAVKDIKLLNCPVQCVSVNSASDTTIDNFLIEVTAGDSEGGHNTDGFDISSSSGITILNSVIKNQDDCVAINQGSNFYFSNLTCSGGHGLSLSVGQSSDNGSPNTVTNVTFIDSVVTKSDNGIHVKTHSDAGTGAVKDVTYKNINLSSIKKYGINIQEDYTKSSGSGDGKPKGNIPITNLEMINVHGKMTGDSSSMPIYILCGDGGCKDWAWSDVSITDGKKGSSCNYQPSGFKC